MSDKTFDINRPVNPGQPSAKLPTLGMSALEGLPAKFAGHIGVDQYLAVLHQSMGDAATMAQDALIEVAKALGVAPPQAFSYSSMSFMPDPANYGLVQWPGLNPESLNKVCRENIAPIVIIRQRVDDVARYGQLSTHIYKPGWNIVMRDSTETPSKTDHDEMARAMKFVANCSMDIDEDPRERDSNSIQPFDLFLRGAVNDMLTYDGWAIWTDTDRSGRVNAFANLSAGLIRLAVPTRGYAGNPKLFAAMVDETGSPVTAFTRDQLVWRVRNVRNDPFVCGYGWPEVEMATRLVQAFQGGIELNASTFTNNAIPNGMLLLKGDYFNQEQIDALMREWTNMKKGVSKLWGLPIMSVPDEGDVEVLQFMDLKGEEVRYRDHLNMMMGLCCLVWRYPIRRLGMFVSGHGRDNAPVQDAAIEIQGADDPGLPPLLMHIEETIDQYMVRPRWAKYAFRFTAKNPKEDARQYEARKLARTWGEARAEADLPKLKTIAPAHLKELAEIMDLAPEDTVKASVFQTVAVKMLEAQLGLQAGKDPANPGAPMEGRKDPAEAQGHGHLSGVRRDSRAEKDSADANRATAGA